MRPTVNRELLLNIYPRACLPPIHGGLPHSAGDSSVVKHSLRMTLVGRSASGGESIVRHFCSNPIIYRKYGLHSPVILATPPSCHSEGGSYRPKNLWTDVASYR